MTDYSELKQCADKATPGEWWIDSHGHALVAHTPEGTKIVFRTDDSMGPATRHAETGNLSHWPNDWDASYIVTAQPATVLALITEVESANSRLHEVAVACATAEQERDQLKAENERLQKFESAYTVWSDKTDWVQETIQGYELGMHRADVLHKRCRDGAFHQQAQADRIKVLMAEVEALRKDAERYRWFRVNSLLVITTARRWVHDLDTEVDTAMAEQAARWSRL